MRGPRGGLLKGTPEYKARQKQHTDLYYQEHREEILAKKRAKYQADQKASPAFIAWVRSQRVP